MRQARHGRQGQDTESGSAKPIRGSVAKRPGGASAQQREAISNTARARPTTTGFRARTLQHRDLRRAHCGRCHRNATRTIMRPTQQEFANPREWLTRLAEESDGYRRLVRESGGTGRAAYRLARARCSATLVGSEPCLDDLQAAAELLATASRQRRDVADQVAATSAKSTPASAALTRSVARRVGLARARTASALSAAVLATDSRP